MEKLLRIFLRTLGGALLLVGLVGAYYGPLEIYVFYMFSPGGKFYYDGFGVGTLWFAYLVTQNLGYYIVAAICIPVGLGHFLLRCWALTLARLYAWFWLGGGLLLVLNIAWVAPSIIRLDLNQGRLVANLLAWGIFVVIAGLLLPGLALGFYYHPKVKAVFAGADPKEYWTERYPFPLLAVLLLFVIIIGVLHLAIFTQGLFPLFGRLLVGRQPVYILSGLIVAAGVLMYGIARLERWAGWGALVYSGGLAVSSLLTFARFSLGEIISRMELPAFETAFLGKLAVLEHFSLVILVTVPLLAVLGLIIYSRRYFNG